MVKYMYLVLLGTMVIIQIYRVMDFKSLTLEKLVNHIEPSWKDGDLEDRIVSVIQVLVTGCISLMGLVGKQWEWSNLFVFMLEFIVLNWIIRFIVVLLEWIQEYIQIATLNTFSALFVPILIINHISKINSKIEVYITFIALVMSVIIVYLELMNIVTGSSRSNSFRKKVYMSKALKIKSIVTWFIIIIVNLYTLLLFIQFYYKPYKHHFIETEMLTTQSAVDLLYYLVVTFSTVGFGDIRPNTIVAKLITIIISISGMLFSGMFIGVILSLEEKENSDKK